MEREILYRAKRKNWEELPKEKWWVEGNLLISNENYYIVPSFGVSFIEELKGYVCDRLITLHAYEVDPETVCQYTGWANENDRKIFEKDIIKVDDLWMGIVVWDFNDTSFNVEPVDDDMEEVERLGVVINGNAVEDIGNIFDNPKLLKGDSK